jgi:hypothetical protein
MTKPTATVTISKSAAEVLRDIAAAEGYSPRQYMEALLHYGASCHKRPGSWEAYSAFDLRVYLSDNRLADKWF